MKCDFDGKCEIDVNNRHVCSYCRLRKCFDSGMQIEMLRGNYSKRSQPNKRRKNGDNATEATSTALCQLTRREHVRTCFLSKLTWKNKSPFSFLSDRYYQQLF